MSFLNTARGPSLLLLAAATALAGCATPGASTTATGPAFNDALPPPDPHNHDVVLAEYEGVVDGTSFTLTRVGSSRATEDVAGTRSSLDTLVTVDAGGTASGTAPSGTGYVSLQNVLPILHESTWDTAHCGPTPTSGTCVQVKLQNMIQDFDLQHVYAEFTDITGTPTNVDGGTGTGAVTFRSNAISDTGYGVTTADGGLERYADLIARAGTAGNRDRGTLYWAFSSTSTPWVLSDGGASTIHFTFHVVIRAHVVTPIIRQSVANGTTDVTSGGGSPGGTAGSGANSGPRQDISGDGNLTVFESGANNLGGTAPNGTQIFLRNNTTNSTSMISLVSGATVPPAGCTSTRPVISDDGSTVAFLSNCRLDPVNDTDGVTDVYYWQGGAPILASFDSNGTKSTVAAQPYLAIGGGVIVWVSASTAMVDQTGACSKGCTINCQPAVVSGTCLGGACNHVWAFDTTGGNPAVRLDMNTATGACGNSGAFAPQANSDGTLVVFDSAASNLVATDVGGFSDVFLADNDPRVGFGVRQIVSLNESGVQANGNSIDSAISSASSDSVGITVAFRSVGANMRSQGNAVAQVYVVHDVSTPSSIVRASVYGPGVSGHAEGTSGVATSDFPSLDQTGRFVAFMSTSQLDSTDASGNADVYVLDMVTTDPGFTRPRRVSQTEAGVGSSSPIDNNTGGMSISDNSNYVVFSGAGDLVPASVGSKQTYRAPIF